MYGSNVDDHISFGSGIVNFDRQNIAIPVHMKLIPILNTFKNYGYETLRPDLLAGITLAMFVLPESMAYATLANLPPVYGIYCCMAGGLFFAFFTGTRKVAVGPTSAISLMVGSGVGALSMGSLSQHIAIASLASFTVFVFFLIAYFLRLSVLVNFVGENVLSGFKIGAALSVASTQLPLFFGVEAGGRRFFYRLWNLFVHLDQTQWQVVLLGVISLVFLFLVHHYLPKWPASLLLVVISLLMVNIFPQWFYAIPAIDPIPRGLPALSFPSLRFDDLEGTLGLAFGCFLVAYIETSAVARTMASKRDESPDLRQELLSLAAANFAVSFAGGYPVSGGLSQSQVNAQAGAKTPFALILCTGFLVMIVMFFTSALNGLPLVILAVLVLYAMSRLFHIKELKRLRELNKAEFGIAMVAVIAVLLFGILKGVIISALLSLVYIIAKTSRPTLAVLGRIPGSTMFSDIAHHSDNEQINGCLIIRVESSILYFNQEHIYETILELLRDRPDTRQVILDLSVASYMDISGSNMLLKLARKLHQKDISFRVVEALSEVRNLLRKQDMEQYTGKISRRISLHEAVQDFESQ